MKPSLLSLPLKVAAVLVSLEFPPLASVAAQAISGRELKPRYAHYGPFLDADETVLDEGWLCISPALTRSPAKTCWNCRAMVAR